MTRFGNGYIKRNYKSEIFQKIELKNPIQDIQFNGRLSKGDTYLIGDGETEKEKFYLTHYHDGSVELWTRRFHRSTFIEETIVCLTDYEADMVYMLIDKFYDIIFNDFEPAQEVQESIEKAAETIELAAQKTGTIKWTDDLKKQFLDLRLVKQLKLVEIAERMGMRTTQIKGIQKYYKSGKMEHLVNEIRCAQNC